jgi:hypothetical protein
MFPQNYIFCDNRMESHTDMHVSQSCNNWLRQRANILIEDTQSYKWIYIYIQLLTVNMLDNALVNGFDIYLAHYTSVLLY